MLIYCQKKSIKSELDLKVIHQVIFGVVAALMHPQCIHGPGIEYEHNVLFSVFSLNISGPKKIYNALLLCVILTHV